MTRHDIQDMFNMLRRDNGLKTNERWKVGRKVIIGYWLRSKHGGGFEPNYYDWCKWTELGNVFSLLDGKGVQQYPNDLKTQVREGFKDKRAGEAWENDYFRVKAYGNGNAHIEFKRIDLLNKFNQIATQQGLRI